MKKGFRKAKVTLRHNREAPPVRIVWDAAIAAGVIGDGRLIPLVILDTSDRPDVAELIRVHQHLTPGDAACQWGQLEGSKGKMALLLTFSRPAETILILEFDIVRQGVLVDQILIAKALYVQSGKEGDRFVTTMDAPKILVEVPHTGFEKEWDRIFERRISKEFRGQLNRQEAKNAAREFIRSLRAVGQLRMKNR